MHSILDEIKPKKTKAVRTTAEIMAEIESLPNEIRKAHSVIKGLTCEIEELDRTSILHGTSCHGGSTDKNFSNHDNQRGIYLPILSHLQKAIGARYLRDMVAESPQGIEATAILNPLFEELAQALEHEQEQAQAAALAARELESAKDAALADLQAQVDQHPLVIEATKKAAPFFRKGELIGV